MPGCGRNAPGSQAIMAGSILGFSLPTFWVGLMLIMVFAVDARAGCRAGRAAARRSTLLGMHGLVPHRSTACGT